MVLSRSIGIVLVVAWLCLVGCISRLLASPAMELRSLIRFLNCNKTFCKLILLLLKSFPRTLKEVGKTCSIWRCRLTEVPQTKQPISLQIKMQDLMYTHQTTIYVMMLIKSPHRSRHCSFRRSQNLLPETAGVFRGKIRENSTIRPSDHRYTEVAAQ